MTTIHRLLLGLLAISPAGCGAEDGDDTALVSPFESDDTGVGDSPDPGDSSWDDVPVYSGGECPLFRSGNNDGFMSAGSARTFRLVLPPNPEGAPVVFAWHWLGGSASQILSYMNFEDLAERENVIVVAPESDGSPYEWHLSDAPSNNPDLVLFDDIVSCLYAQFQIDPTRIHATGMSAGGLWATYLTAYRSEILASTAPFSGGVNTPQYVSPARALPVMLTWGGPSDTYGAFSFHTASQDFSASLRNDGSFVVECMHAGGHTIPASAAEFSWQFFKDHPLGVNPLPYIDGLPSALPSYCSVP